MYKNTHEICYIADLDQYQSEMTDKEDDTYGKKYVNFPHKNKKAKRHFHPKKSQSHFV